MPKYFIIIIVWLSLLFPNLVVSAQDDTENPIYIVQEGDTLGIIALRFGITLDELMSANGLTDPNSVLAGAKLIIPGLKGIQGTLITKSLPIGESLYTMTLRHKTPIKIIVRLNRITSPTEVYAGTNLVLPQLAKDQELKPTLIVEPKQSLFELALLSQVNPWMLKDLNQQEGSWDILPGETIFLASESGRQELNPISPAISSLTIDPLPLSQGKTTLIRIETAQSVNFSGTLGNQNLFFYKNTENEFVAIVGIPALEEPGLVRFTITGNLSGGKKFQFEQNVLLQSGLYGEDPPLEVDPSTLDPESIIAEENQIVEITSHSTPQRYWSEPFMFPIDEPCIRSWFGNRRLYNSGAYQSFHSGVDFGVCANNLNIYAAAPGTVVFAGPLSIRGNATIIDHGWGIFTGYWHQSEIKVVEGDFVEAGQLIGIIGSTGRATGPHLHWELRVHGVPVNPLDWIDRQIP